MTGLLKDEKDLMGGVVGEGGGKKSHEQKYSGWKAWDVFKVQIRSVVATSETEKM